MNQFSLSPIEIKEDVMIVHEPFASKIIESLYGNIPFKHEDYISLSLEKVGDKKQFIEEIVFKIKKAQQNMINGFLSKKCFNYL